MPAPVASGGSESPGGPCTHWKAPPCHSPTSYFILRNINLLRHNIQILANMVSRSARRRPPLCVAARRAFIFEGWVRGREFTHTDHAVDIDNGLAWTIIVVAAGHRHYGGVVTRPRRRCLHFVPACDRAGSAPLRSTHVDRAGQLRRNALGCRVFALFVLGDYQRCRRLDVA